jgi:hypothetical protein
MKRTHATVAAAALASIAFLGIAGCSGSGAHGSRAELYDSVSGLASDSTVVLAGTVEEQNVVQDIPDGGDFTLSTVTVAETAKADTEHPAGSTLVVRQHGTEGEPGPAGLLEKGKTYLLYLTPSGLDGDLASQFYVTGGSAGIYVTEQNEAARSAGGVVEGTEFTKQQSDEGDQLPEQLTLDEALQG